MNASMIRIVAATAAVVGAIVAANALRPSAPSPSQGGESATSAVAERPSAEDSVDTATSHDPAPADALTGDSTLARWLAAKADERTPIAVALARNFLKPDASKLEIARAAMEITGCLTRTAKDPGMSAWKVAPTANICLTAPVRPR